MQRPSLDLVRSRLDPRRQAILATAAVTGVLVGLAIAAFDKITGDVLLGRLFRASLPVQALTPVVGLLVAALALRYLAGGASPSTSDEYVRFYHDRNRRFDLRPMAGRVIASIATLGSGGALGFEGPSIYIGAGIGSALQRRLSRLFRRDEAKALLIAGAAGGVAAIFKAPATGVLFALEVPYRDGITPRGMLSALVAGATSYLTYAALIGTEPLFRLSTRGSTTFRLQELAGALVVGLLAGLGARAFAIGVRWSKSAANRAPAWARVVLAGAGLAGLVLATHAMYDQALSLGPGYRTFAWMSSPDRALWLVAALFAFRFGAALLTLGGGGSGGLFIPLVMQGALLGRFVAGAYDGLGLSAAGHVEASSSLFPVLGIASFLGAGYRTPLAAVMFVAESTGDAVFVVPALVAAAISQLVMGHETVSSTQAESRTGALERRLPLPVSSVLRADVLTVPPDATVAEFVWVHLVGNRQRSVPVVDGSTYVGMCGMEEVAMIERGAWDDTTVADIMRTDLPVGVPSWTIRDALQALERADVDCLGVVGPDGTFAGELRTSEIMKLAEILSETE
ncbi:MAG TPA: chloride channel protein [Acidimicrobiales bacterium]|nr:chloride channel protein [Acidimicrobiales bacterium]